jgi:hypothetical protein
LIGDQIGASTSKRERIEPYGEALVRRIQYDHVTQTMLGHGRQHVADQISLAFDDHCATTGFEVLVN